MPRLPGLVPNVTAHFVRYLVPNGDTYLIVDLDYYLVSYFSQLQLVPSPYSVPHGLLFTHGSPPKFGPGISYPVFDLVLYPPCDLVKYVVKYLVPDLVSYLVHELAMHFMENLVPDFPAGFGPELQGVFLFTHGYPSGFGLVGPLLGLLSGSLLDFEFWRLPGPLLGPRPPRHDARLGALRGPAFGCLS